ncbi:predicted protein [Phaeodactylum tricornutum CCAP 1055/1]|uniref:Uncharacterized protein n=5 Tax=Phaeodactylum tricornutum TaxID=2850 RepID=B7FPV5_PHATC|nr:predicted protein [Phaeodactylum tricornutum CCAP 1055/1]EEC51745.1 predicted protein [Phaeodactylum tricornutum CCAP 1055/1]|eukprot:XP_002177282.1 predicted protein [Phaeodactylum tricornutum CCAP 1055/1]
MKTRQIDSVLLRVLFGWVIVGHVSAFSHVRIGHFSTKRDVLASEVSKRRKAVEYAARKTHLLVVSLPDSLIEEVSTQALLDKIIDEGIRTSARRPIMFQFDPSSTAIWKHWKGTIFAETWPSVVRHVLWAVLVYFLFRRNPGSGRVLSDFSTLWGQTLSVTTFTLTFFVNQSYTLWRTCLSISRTLQGRLNDLAMALAVSARRVDPQSPESEEGSQFTPSSRQLLLVVARYVRLFNIFSYASFTRSHRPLLTPRGMRRMVDRGLLTSREPTQRHNAVLMWIFRAIIDGRRAGLLDGGPGFEQQVMNKVQEIRAQANSMESELRGRMPFAYAHVVQVLVDLILWMYPIGAFSSGMSLPLGLFGTVLLTSCYQSLFDLAKQFLDPFHNESFWNGDDALNVDTLIAETNAGSLRWMFSLDEMPIPYRCFNQGDLSAFILPDDGFSTKHLEAKAAMESEKANEPAESITLLTPEELQQKAAEILEAAEEEYEETKRILNAPPGSDSIPELEVEAESGDARLLVDNNTDELLSIFETEEKGETIASEMFDMFTNAAEEEYKELTLNELGEVLTVSIFNRQRPPILQLVFLDAHSFDPTPHAPADEYPFRRLDFLQLAIHLRRLWCRVQNGVRESRHGYSTSSSSLVETTTAFADVYSMEHQPSVFMLCDVIVGFTIFNITGCFRGFNILWGQLLSVTTFTLTFFVNQSYALWRKCYELSRRLQGRLHDLNLTLAAHACRKAPASPNEPSTYTPAARHVLELVSRYIRLFNLLTYASFTRSHRPILTPRGMRRLVERGLMTAEEREILVDAELPATQRHNAILLWIARTFVEGREAGHFQGGAGFEEQFLEKIHVCRAQYGAIGDELQGRMPLAYAHIVQVLVDLVLWMYPLMAISSNMSPMLAVLGTGLLTVSYQGLFDLAKQFLDPYDNESYGKGEDPLVVDTLIAETNAGSIRWMHGLEQMPVSSQRIKDGELSDYLLPVRGYTVEELEQFEQERLQKEREIQKKRDKQEATRRKEEAEAQRIRRAADAILPAQITVSSSCTDLADSSIVVGPQFSCPGILGHSNILVASEVSRSLYNLTSVVSDRDPSLVPEGIPISRPHVLSTQSPIKNFGNDTQVFVNGDGSSEYTVSGELGDYTIDRDSSLDFEEDEDEIFASLLDWDSSDGYVHAFDSSDPYKDLPWHDELTPDGKEIRLSQMLADEVWEEELEAGREMERLIRSQKDNEVNIGKINGATVNELIETRDILMASPGADIYAPPAKENSSSDAVYDQTKLDGISQLWGLPADEIPEIPGYQETSISQNESQFEDVAQLWGSVLTRSSPSSLDTVEDEQSFYEVSQLWGDSIAESPQDRPKFETQKATSFGTQRGSRSQRISQEPGYPFRAERSIDGKELRLSQILADETYVEDFEPDEIETTTLPVSYEEYTKQVAEILVAEQEELLETAAILNAPPAADTVDLGDGDGTSHIKAANATDYDELAVLEMDESTSSLPLNSTEAIASSASGGLKDVNDDVLLFGEVETMNFEQPSQPSEIDASETQLEDKKEGDT